MAILDQHGSPIQRATLTEPQTAHLTSLRGEWQGHPTRGLTPAKLAAILQAAETCDLTQLADLGEDMEEKDAHIYAELSKRKRALLTLDWNVVPPRNPSAAEKKAAELAEGMLADLPFLGTLILDMADAIGKGYSCQEIEWQLVGREWMPSKISHRPASWFTCAPADRTTLLLRDFEGRAGRDAEHPHGAPLRPFGWIAHVHAAKSGYITRSALHRVLAWPFLFKNYAVRDLAEFLEIYGLPLRVGTYPPGAGDKEKATLLAAVVGIGHNAAGIIPEGMMIDFKEAAKGTHEPFQAMLDWCEKSESKAILGGTLTSQADGKSSTNALGNVHNEVRHDLLLADALQVAATITRDLVYPLLALNTTGVDGLRRCPRFTFDVREPEDLKAIGDGVKTFVDMGLRVPAEWAYEKARIPQPKDGEAVLERAARAAPGAVPGADPENPEDDAPAPKGNAQDAAAAEAARAAARAICPVHGTAVLAGTRAKPDLIDALAALGLEDWEPHLQPLVSAIAAEARAAATAAEGRAQFGERLLRLLDNGTQIEAFSEALARASFVARLLGEANVDAEHAPGPATSGRE